MYPIAMTYWWLDVQLWMWGWLFWFFVGVLGLLGLALICVVILSGRSDDRR
jgi:hypothetical protein